MALSAVDCVTDNRCFYNLKIKNKYYEANKANTIQDVLPSCGALIHKMLNGKKTINENRCKANKSCRLLGQIRIPERQPFIPSTVQMMGWLSENTVLRGASGELVSNGFLCNLVKQNKNTAFEVK